jgi:hypothetical protein
MKKDLKSFVDKLQQNDNGTWQGGFGSVRGGFATDPITPANGDSCSNPGTCTSTNIVGCTNSGDCKGTTDQLACSNTGFCFA